MELRDSRNGYMILRENVEEVLLYATYIREFKHQYAKLMHSQHEHLGKLLPLTDSSDRFISKLLPYNSSCSR